MVGSVAPKHFNVPKHRRFVEDHGITTTWYKAIVCPCRSRKDGSIDPDCNLCGGEGVHYYDPQDIIALYTSLSFEKPLSMPGFVDEVLINCTFKDEHEVADGDRFVPLHEIIVENELFKRGDTKPGGGTAERLVYRYPVALQKVIDVNENEYIPGTDVELIDDPAGYTRIINWITAGPANGARYSVRYQARAEFYCFLTQPRIRVEGNVKQVTFTRLRRITPLRSDS